jgi:hypothetical protein
MNNDLIQSKFLEGRKKMSNEKNVSKELTDAVNKVLSRREAVKKVGSIAAGAALAFLGLGMPGVSQQKEAWACHTCCQYDCLGTCRFSCEGDCTGGCSDVCMNECTNSCDSWCQFDCIGGCTGGCEGGCYGNCYGGCVTTCADGCGNNCEGSCFWTESN